jgi:hypothetical protein
LGLQAVQVAATAQVAQLESVQLAFCWQAAPPYMTLNPVLQAMQLVKLMQVSQFPLKYELQLSLQV